MKLARTMSPIALLAVLLMGLGSGAHHHAASAPMVSPDVSADSKHGAKRASTGDGRRARAALRNLSREYRYLDGVTVALGTTPHGEEAVAYYTERKIVISRDHTVDVATILAHEVWHIIDWRDNGRLDWGEQLPPSDASAYEQ